MVTVILDSNIIIDLLRGYIPAQAWIATQTNPGISRATWMELIGGARDSGNQREILKLLKEFELVEFANSDFEWASQQLARFRLSHGVEAFDCLIAAPAHRLQLPLYTRNLKHFEPLLGGLAVVAY